MANTTYDQIFTTFLSESETDNFNIPNDPVKIKDLIHTSILHFNNRLRDELVYDDVTETVNRELNNDELLILAHLLRLIFLKNKLTYFTTLFQPFQKDIGLKNYSDTVRLLKEMIKEEDDYISMLIINTWDGE